MISAIFWFMEISFLVGALALYIVNNKETNSTKRNQWIKYVVYFFIVHTAILSALAGPQFFTILVVAIIIIGLYELVRVYKKMLSSRSHLSLVALSLVVYLLLAFGLFYFSIRSNSKTIIFLYITIVTFDGFSQIIGQLIGKHQLVPKLSPKKTIEGTLGGCCAAIIAALTLRSLADFSISQALIVGFMLSIASLLGDLTASWFKRINNIKDFSRILPGHGGILDRFDSLLVAASIFMIYSRYAL
ncbi:phosphatidate cytidylyltransferase [Candidatus Latescibacterota bacterium]